jgi:peptidyl-prolyl cis-trans isomerase B (cyclophilin B)
LRRTIIHPHGELEGSTIVAKNTKAQEKAERERLRAYRERQKAHRAQEARRKRDNRLWLSIGIPVVALAIGAQVLFTVLTPYSPTPSASETPAAPTNFLPDKSASEDRVWTGEIVINGIPLGVELDGKAAPQAVASTVYLADKGFYNGVNCHRLTTEALFVLQCGDPKGDGTGGPGYYYGPVENDPVDGIYPAGTIAMARLGGEPNSIGSQFFIVYKETVLPAEPGIGGYSVIGRITSGLPELEAAVISGGVADGTGDGKPAIETVIGSFTLQ